MRESDIFREALSFSVSLHELGGSPVIARSVLTALGEGALGLPTAQRLMALAEEHPDIVSLLPLTMGWAGSLTRAVAEKAETTAAGAGAGRTVIHTDGACSGNPGPGGWAVIVDHGGVRTGRYGGEPATTNNRMEMTAMIAAFREAARTGGEVIIRADSEYVLKGLTEWLPGWEARGWRNASGKPVVNRDLWEGMKAARAAASKAGARVSLEHVRGHSGDPGNEACDELAVRGREEARHANGPFENALPEGAEALPSP